MQNMRMIAAISLLGTSMALQPPRTASGFPTGQNAAYNYRVIVSGLANPTDIRLGGDRGLYIAQRPAAPRDASLSKVDLGSGELTQIGTGPAVLSGFAVTRSGRIFWVDGAKNALMTQENPSASPKVVETNRALTATTITVDGSDRVYVARARSGADMASVMVRGGEAISIRDTGGPPKTALVAASTGDLYWTSKEDGSIYHLGPDGRGSLVLAGLDKPQGIALDPEEENLFFTEVPTPGIAGESGGRNTVNVLDLATKRRAVIHAGDPQPTGVAAAANGTVYWSSTSRGLVMAAVPALAVATVAPYVATLSGEQEIPPVVTSAQGTVTFKLTPDVQRTSRSEDDDDEDDDAEDSEESRPSSSTGGALDYVISINPITNVRRVEIRQGGLGVTGPLVATLSRVISRDEAGSVLSGGTSYSGRGRIRAQDLRGPFEDNFKAFTDALATGGLYVNVLTRSSPSGEVRGQILAPGTTPPPPGGTPPNTPPRATITAPSAGTMIQAGQSVLFAGTATDAENDLVSVLWDLGDGTTSAALAPGSHSYPVAGTYTVRLTATDARGLVDPAPPTRVITVQPVVVNQPPSAAITTPAANVTITAGQSVSFSGTASDPNGDAVTVLWNFGDGATSTLLVPGAHVYATAGTFTARLTATDAKGLAATNPPTRTVTVQAVVANRPPVGTITAPTAATVTINAGQAVSFGGTATDPDGDAVTALWNFGDGSTSAALNPGNHTYANAGTFTVRLTATDARGLAAASPPTRTIVVNSVAAGPTLTQLQTAIFTPSCTSCHDAGGSAGLNLVAGSSYSNLVNRPASTMSGMRVVPGNPGASALVTMLASGHRSVSAANQALISSWISGGAPNN